MTECPEAVKSKGFKNSNTKWKFIAKNYSDFELLSKTSLKDSHPKLSPTKALNKCKIKDSSKCCSKEKARYKTSNPSSLLFSSKLLRSKSQTLSNT